MLQNTSKWHEKRGEPRCVEVLKKTLSITHESHLFIPLYISVFYYDAEAARNMSVHTIVNERKSVPSLDQKDGGGGGGGEERGELSVMCPSRV